MNTLQKVNNIIIGILLLCCSIMMVIDPETGYLFWALILCLTLLFTAVRQLRFYASMARHMVGGKMILYRGIIMLDLAIFTLYMSEVPKLYAALYLIACLAFSSIVDLLHAREAKALKSRAWISELLQGAGKLIIVVICLASLNNLRIVLYVYCFQLFCSGIHRLASAFRSSAVIYVQ